MPYFLCSNLKGAKHETDTALLWHSYLVCTGLCNCNHIPLRWVPYAEDTKLIKHLFYGTSQAHYICYIQLNITTCI
jgi:hypothetical protein